MTMRPMVLAAVGMFLCGVPLAGMARGEINIVDSLEWMAVDSPVIVEGKVADVTEAKAEGGGILCDVTLKDVRVRKGDVKAEDVKIRMLDPQGKQTALNWQKAGDTYLFFLAQGTYLNDRGKWVPRRDGAIDLDHPEKVHLATMKNAQTREEILKVVEAYSTWKPAADVATRPAGTASTNVKPGSLWRDVPFDSAIFKEVWAGSSCYIVVPAEEKYRTEVLAMVKDASVEKRQQGAAMLGSYPGPETIKVLTELLRDQGEAQQTDGKRLMAIVYPVRQAAYIVLTAIGEKPEKPVVERVPTPDEVKAWEAARPK